MAPSYPSWTRSRRVLPLLILVTGLSALLWGYAAETEWMEQIQSSVATLPSITSAGWGSKLVDGSRTTIKPTAQTFLAAYNDWKNSSGKGHCTPSVGQISVTINGVAVENVKKLDVSKSYDLYIDSSCDGIPGAGDFYETLLTTPFYHGRINLYNQFNGVHIGEPLKLPFDMVEQGHPIRLQIWRLYREFEGIENHREVKAPFIDGKYTREEIVDVTLPLEGSLGRKAEDRPICQASTFDQHTWTGGFWWREEETDAAWTFYRADCKAKKFSTDQASACLAGRKLLYFGDSTTQDMVRNTFWTLLGVAFPKKSDLPADFARVGHWNTTHPGHPNRWTSISIIFNGHYDLRMNRLGMNSFKHEAMIDRHEKFFDVVAKCGAEVDTILVNSGLHDCWLRPTPEKFVDDFAVGWQYYMKKFREIETRQTGRPPQIVYRYSNTPPFHLNGTLATPMNPSSMEMVNLLEREYLERYNADILGGRLTYLDSFEATWPWHFDGEMNSGPHYGRPPWGSGNAKAKRLVDVMMVQFFLTRLCPDASSKAT